LLWYNRYVLSSSLLNNEGFFATDVSGIALIFKVKVSKRKAYFLDILTQGMEPITCPETSLKTKLRCTTTPNNEESSVLPVVWGQIRKVSTYLSNCTTWHPKTYWSQLL